MKKRSQEFGDITVTYDDGWWIVELQGDALAYTTDYGLALEAIRTHAKQAEEAMAFLVELYYSYKLVSNDQG